MFKQLNGFLKKASFYVFMALCFGYASLSAVKVDGQELTSIIESGATLVCTDSSSNNICISVKDGNIEVGSLHLSNVEGVKDFLKQLKDGKDTLYQNISKDIVKLSLGSNILINGAYISGDSKVILETQKKIDISNAILKSKKVAFVGNELKADGCFLDTDELQIESNVPESIFQAIIFTFNKNIQIPASIAGEISFVKDETTGNLLVVGAQEVRIVFASKVFENNK